MSDIHYFWVSMQNAHYLKQTVIPALVVKMSTAQSWLSLLLTVHLFAITSCQAPPSHKVKTIYRHKDTTVRHINHKQAHHFAHPAVHENDWIVETPIGTLLIAGDHKQHSRHHAPGSIAGIIRNNHFSDNFSAALQMDSNGNSESNWQATTITPKISHGELGLAIVHVSANNQIVVRSFLSYAPSTNSIKWWSRIQNVGGTPLKNTAIGSTVYWDGGFVFAPGHGFIEESKKAVAPWLAMKSDGITSALVLRKHTYKAGFLFDPHGPYQNNLNIKTLSLAPKESFHFEQHILMAQGGLEKIAPHAWRIAQIPFGIIRGKVTPMQSWGEIEISARNTSATLVAQLEKDGSYKGAVPYNEYNVTLVTPGGRQLKHSTISPNKSTATVNFSSHKPGILHYQVSNSSLSAIPARLVVRGVPPTRNPQLGPKHKASGAENIIYSAKGAGAVELPAGTYRVLFTHGPEFSLDEKEIVLQKGRHMSISAELHRTIDSNGWLAADFHLHAEPSYDSSVSLKDRAISLFAEDIDIAVATDHNVVTDYANAVAAVNIKKPIFAIPGVEVTTTQPKWGHFNVWPWPTVAEPPPWTNQSAHQIFQYIRDQHPSSVIQVNHPRMDYHNIGYFTLASLNLEKNIFEKGGASFDFDAIEIFNGMDLKNPNIVSENLTEWFSLLNLGYRFTATGNSDSHFLVGHFAGYPRTYLQVRKNEWAEASEAEFTITDTEHPATETQLRQNIFSIEDVAYSVKRGHAFVSNGPFFEAAIDDATFGDELTVKNGARKKLYIQIQTSPWLPIETVQVIVNGEIQHQKSVIYKKNGAISDIEFVLKFTRDSWVVVKAYGSVAMTAVLPGSKTSPLAFSNPIWIKIDE